MNRTFPKAMFCSYVVVKFMYWLFSSLQFNTLLPKQIGGERLLFEGNEQNPIHKFAEKEKALTCPNGYLYNNAYTVLSVFFRN